MNLKSLWQKYVPDWKALLRKSLPYALVAVFASATVFAVVGVQATQQEYMTINGTKAELATQKQELEAALTQTQTLLSQLTAVNTDTQTLLE